MKIPSFCTSPGRAGRLRRVLLAMAAVVVLLAAGVVGAAWYLIDYALCPTNIYTDQRRAWADMDALYPGLQAWGDSLRKAGVLRDTTLTALDGTTLHALYAHAPVPTHRTALLVHGYGSCAVGMMHLGRMYHRDFGVNILLPDLRHSGLSGGDHIQMGWLDKDDVELWADQCPLLFGDNATVVVHGVSMGAATTAMLSGDSNQPPCIQLYVEDCGYTSVMDQFRKELAERFSLPAWPLLPLASRLCKWRYGWSFEEASAVPGVRKSRGPMFFIHGTADKYVLPWMGDSLYAAHPGPKARWWVEGAAHAKSYAHDPELYAKKVRRFLLNEHFL